MPPPRPHPLARAPIVDRLDRWLATAWEKGLLSRPPLDAEAIMRAGRGRYTREDEEGGRSAEEAADFRIRLEHLTAALESEARLNNLGRTIAHGQLARVVRQRHALGRIWRRNPERAQTALADPIIVIGQMRAGTTRIHRLLAADPVHSATRFCDSWNPVPSRFDLRPMWSGFALFCGRRLDPWIDTIHPFGAGRVDEELGWLASALGASAYEAQWRVPSYSRFNEARDAGPIYAEFGRILSTDAAFHRNADRPRVMKVPQFAEDLPTLLLQFPRARLVVARREDADVARSAASLVANQMTIQSDEVDLAWIEREWTRKIALRRERVQSALAHHDGPVAEVDFDAISSDWRSAVRRIYADLDLQLTPAALSSMEREQRIAGQDSHHAHKRQLAQFGEIAG